MNLKRTMLSFVLVAFYSCMLALAEMPRQFYFEDFHNDTNGIPFTGFIGLQLQLFADATNNWPCLYEDSNTVEVVDGFYATLIGDNTVFGSLSNALAGGETYVQVIIDGVPLSPREPLVPVPYALNAASLATNVVTSAAISDGAVTASKLAADVDDRFINADGDTMEGDFTLSGDLWSTCGRKIALGFDGDGDGEYLQNTGYGVGIYAGYALIGDFHYEDIQFYKPVHSHGDLEVMGELSVWNGSPGTGPDVLVRRAVGTSNDALCIYPDVPDHIPASIGPFLLWDSEGNIPTSRLNAAVSSLLTNFMTVTSVFSACVAKSGDTMTGDLSLAGSLILLPTAESVLSSGFQSVDDVTIHWMTESGTYFKYGETESGGDRFYFGSDGSFQAWGDLHSMGRASVDGGLSVGGDASVSGNLSIGDQITIDAAAGIVEAASMKIGSVVLGGTSNALVIPNIADSTSGAVRIGVDEGTLYGDWEVEGRGSVKYEPEIGTNQYALWVRNFGATPDDARGLLVTTPEYNGAEGIIFHAASLAGGSMASRFIVGADGNVGVGVNNPQNKLHVAGDTRISGNVLMMDGQDIISPDLDPGDWGSAFDKWGPNAYLKYGFVRELLVAQNAEFQSRVKIGTSSDYAILNVGAPTNLVTPTYAARFESALGANSDKARGLLINFPNNMNEDSILFHAMSGPGPYTNSRVVIKADGHVGIGTPNPESTLHVNGDTLIQGTLRLMPTEEKVLSPGFQTDGDVTIHWMTDSGTYFKYGETASGGDRIHFGSDGSIHAWGDVWADGTISAGSYSGGTEAFPDIPWSSFSASTNTVMKTGDTMTGDLSVEGQATVGSLATTGSVLAAGIECFGPVVISAAANQTNLVVAGWAKIDYIPPQGGISMGVYTNR